MDRVLASQNSYHLIPYYKRYENTAENGPGPQTLQERALTLAPWFIGREQSELFLNDCPGWVAKLLVFVYFFFSIAAPKTTRRHY